MPSKDRLFVAFALWAGAWALVHLASSALFEIQMALYTPGQEGMPFDLGGTPHLGAALVIILCARWMQRFGWQLVLFMALFGLIHEYLNYFSGLLYAMRLDVPLDEGSSSLNPFDWRLLGLEVAGYVIGGLLVAPRWGFRPFGRAILNWLQFDSAAYGRWWRWWLSLPLWSYAAPIKRGIGKALPPYFALAGALSLAGIMGAQIYPLTYSAGFGVSGGPLQQFAANNGPHLFLTFICAFAAGRILHGLGYGARWVWSGIAALVLLLQDLHFSLNYYLQQATSGLPISLSDMLTMSIGPMSLLVLAFGLMQGQRSLKRP